MNRGPSGSLLLSRAIPGFLQYKAGPAWLLKVTSEKHTLNFPTFPTILCSLTL